MTKIPQTVQEPAQCCQPLFTLTLSHPHLALNSQSTLFIPPLQVGFIVCCGRLQSCPVNSVDSVLLLGTRPCLF